MTTDSIPQAAPAVPAPIAPDIPETVARLRKTFATGRTRSVEWRKQQLKAIEKMMTENEAAIAVALEQDLGRKPFEAWLADIAPTAGEAEGRRQERPQVDAAQAPDARDVAAARPRLDRVRALRHGARSSARGTSRSR